ncbi:hemerythrin-like protein [Artemisia annua]|uniref:Hemerythrin-like protein n=1 Tax=Artemisia annua TaxID=35608 RepID=A0A2U1NY74_ARTAN|nr:hemerythrin-like protein [Artemisia annua]
MGNCSKTLKKTNPDNFTPPKNKSKQTHQKPDPPPPYRKVDISDVLTPLRRLLSPATLPVVRLYGSPSSPATSYIHFAILYKPVTLMFIPSETPDFGFETPVIQYNADVISGSSVTILRYLDRKFPKPLLLSNWDCEKMPMVVTATVLHHKSLTWHLERMVTWSEDLATRGGKSRGDPVMGSGRMEVKKYAKSYSMLLELLLEHAQMEERLVFPVLEREDRGLSKTVTEEHARDLPLMNGIKEDIKTIIVLDTGSASCSDAIYSLSTRIKSLLENCKEHFDEEERGILPLMEAAELTQGQQEKLLEQSLDVMPSTHSHLLKFFMEGLQPQEAMLYLDLITRCTDKDRAGSIYRFLVEDNQGKRIEGRPTMGLLLKAKS